MANNAARKAIIPLGGKGHSSLAMQSLEMESGERIPVIHFQIRQLLEAGIEQVALVINPDARDSLMEIQRDFGTSIIFFEQKMARGFGHALLCAREWVGNDPVLVQVSDHFFLSNSAKSCAAQIVEAWKDSGVTVLALNRVNEREVPRLGLVSGKRLASNPLFYQVNAFLEKPSLTQAEQIPHVSGLRSGEYLCSAGLHVFSPRFMDILAKMAAEGDGTKGKWLGQALVELMKVETCMGMEIQGRRINLEDQYGMLRAQLAMALASPDAPIMNEILLQEVSFMAAGATHGK